MGNTISRLAGFLATQYRSEGGWSCISVHPPVDRHTWTGIQGGGADGAVFPSTPQWTEIHGRGIIHTRPPGKGCRLVPGIQETGRGRGSESRVGTPQAPLRGACLLDCQSSRRAKYLHRSPRGGGRKCSSIRPPPWGWTETLPQSICDGIALCIWKAFYRLKTGESFCCIWQAFYRLKIRKCKVRLRC